MDRFDAEQRALLLGIKGVGPTVVARLEQLGLHILEALAACTPHQLTAQAAALVGSTCWRNSPQAHAAMAAAIAAAQAHSAKRSSKKSSSIR
ncbi:helix-hairpin-helix domain-containing protein [Xanthomonas theicola]|uniref:Pathogenicity locus n=1 Tax=Xanthomonas theicola TaxID=56464 RepID=A0A2S6ZGU0_9XANT|nr:helix-hairpin-helix domain-containing protein [Xanthomonas theicola]PPT91473.1 Pathogenicity locus [Xanthomonas theicola]QNH24495.1 helix-hairpin-helix domain-containing protein [Xanthomonas theicola]